MSGIDQSFRSQPPKAGPAPIPEWVTPDVMTLSNGIKVIVVTNDKLPVISATMSFDAGLYFEGNRAGVGRITSQLMVRGTENYSKATLDDKIDFLGLAMHASPTTTHVRGLKKFSDSVMEMLAEITRLPTFPENEFDVLKNQATSGMAAEKHEASVIASNIEHRVNYPESHPYHSVMTVESLKAISLSDCRDYYQSIFTPANAFLILIGDIQSAEAFDLAASYFGDWQVASQPKLNPDPIIPLQKNSWHIGNKTGAAQSLISFSYPVSFRYDDPDRISAILMNTVLGGYFSSRLNANLREGKGYTYGIRSSLIADDYAGSFHISVNVRTEVTNDTIHQIMKEMNQLRHEIIYEEELKSVKAVLAGSFAHSFENPGTLAQFAVNSLRYHLPDDYYQTYLKRLESVTASDIQAMAVRFLRPDCAHIVVVGNEEALLSSLPEVAGDVPLYRYNYEGMRIGSHYPPLDSSGAETVNKQKSENLEANEQ